MLQRVATALVIVAVCAASLPASAQLLPTPSSLLRYRFTKGEVVRYSVTTEVSASFSPRRVYPLSLRHDLATSYTVVDVSRETATLNAPILLLDSMPTLAVKEGGRGTRSIDRRGRLTKRAPNTLQSIVTELFVTLPEKSVRPGSAWYYPMPSLSRTKPETTSHAVLRSIEYTNDDVLANIVVTSALPLDDTLVSIMHLFQVPLRPSIIPAARQAVSGRIGVTEEVVLSLKSGHVLRRKSTAGGTLTVSAHEPATPQSVAYQATTEYRLIETPKRQPARRK